MRCLTDEGAHLVDGGGKIRDLTLDRAIGAAPAGVIKTQLERAKEVFGKYTAGIDEMAAARKDILVLQSNLGEQGVAWNKDIKELSAKL